MKYEWDIEKAIENRRKHHIDFADAVGALEDPRRLEEIDDRLDYGEERTRIIGMSTTGFFSSSRLCAAMRHAALFPPGGPQDMNKAGTTQVAVTPGELPPRGDTDWARLDAMTEAEVLEAARSDPDAQPLSPEELGRFRRVSRVKVLRERLGMTQVEFAEAFGLPVSTLRDWEQQRSKPDAPARALLRAIEREPETMKRLLARAA